MPRARRVLRVPLVSQVRRVVSIFFLLERFRTVAFLKMLPLFSRGVTIHLSLSKTRPTTGVNGFTGASGSTGPDGSPGGPANLLPLISVKYGGTCAIQDPGCYLCLNSYNPAAGCAACAAGYRLATQPLGGRRTLSSTFVPYCVGSVFKNTVENEIVNAFGQLQPAINAADQAKLNALDNIVHGVNSTVSTVEGAKANAISSISKAVNAKVQVAEAATANTLSSISGAISSRVREDEEGNDRALSSIRDTLNSTLHEVQGRLQPPPPPDVIAANKSQANADGKSSAFSSIRGALSGARASLQDMIRDPLRASEEKKAAIASLVNDLSSAAAAEG